MKKILFVISHYYKENRNSPYGSGKESEKQRLNSFSNTLKAIYKNFGRYSKVIVCTCEKNHLVKKLSKKMKIFHETRKLKNPLYLGFECQNILLDNIQEYDYFCYLEDDLIIEDKLFFDKLELFNKYFGANFLLQPNRFENNPEYFEKYYIDGINSMWKEKTLSFKDKHKTISFIKSFNPHSGCYFLNKTQMEKIANSKSFRKKTKKFVGPLESAASYSIKKNFYVYKPSLLNRGWLEVRHARDRYLKDYLAKASDPMSYFYNRLKEILLSQKFWKLLLTNNPR